MNNLRAFPGLQSSKTAELTSNQTLERVAVKMPHSRESRCHNQRSRQKDGCKIHHLPCAHPPDSQSHPSPPNPPRLFPPITPSLPSHQPPPSPPIIHPPLHPSSTPSLPFETKSTELTLSELCQGSVRQLFTGTASNSLCQNLARSKLPESTTLIERWDHYIALPDFYLSLARRPSGNSYLTHQTKNHAGYILVAPGTHHPPPFQDTLTWRFDTENVDFRERFVYVFFMSTFMCVFVSTLMGVFAGQVSLSPALCHFHECHHLFQAFWDCDEICQKLGECKANVVQTSDFLMRMLSHCFC